MKKNTTLVMACFLAGTSLSFTPLLSAAPKSAPLASLNDAVVFGHQIFPVFKSVSVEIAGGIDFLDELHGMFPRQPFLARDLIHSG